MKINCIGHIIRCCYWACIYGNHGLWTWRLWQQALL